MACGKLVGVSDGHINYPRHFCAVWADVTRMRHDTELEPKALRATLESGIRLNRWSGVREDDALQRIGELAGFSSAST